MTSSGRRGPRRPRGAAPRCPARAEQVSRCAGLPPERVVRRPRGRRARRRRSGPWSGRRRPAPTGRSRRRGPSAPSSRRTPTSAAWAPIGRSERPRRWSSSTSPAAVASATATRRRRGRARRSRGRAGSTTRLPAKRSPPMCEVSHTCVGVAAAGPGRAPAGRPSSAQQASWRPWVQTASSGRVVGRRGRASARRPARRGRGRARRRARRAARSRSTTPGRRRGSRTPGRRRRRRADRDGVRAARAPGGAGGLPQVRAEPVGQPGVAQRVGAPRAGVLEQQEAAHGRGGAGELVTPLAAGRGTAGSPSPDDLEQPFPDQPPAQHQRALGVERGRSPGVSSAVGRDVVERRRGPGRARAAPGRRGARAPRRRRRRPRTGGRRGGAAGVAASRPAQRRAVEQRAGQARADDRLRNRSACSAATAAGSRRRTAVGERGEVVAERRRPGGPGRRGSRRAGGRRGRRRAAGRPHAETRLRQVSWLMPMVRWSETASCARAACGRAGREVGHDAGLEQQLARAALAVDLPQLGAVGLHARRRRGSRSAPRSPGRRAG